MAFYCNGKKDMCDCDILCADCGFYDNTGGKKFQTNADRIRAMSDEELADWLARTQIANVAAALEVAKLPYEPGNGLKDEVAKDCLEWLKQPVGEVSE